MKKRWILFLLCFALLPVTPTAAAGEIIDTYTVCPAEGITLTGASRWEADRFQSEHYITLTPDAGFAVRVVCADPMQQRESLAAAAERLEAEGFHVLGGSNGGYYTVSTGEPVGLLVSDGLLLCDDEKLNALGFRADGSAVMGLPKLTLSLTVSEEATLPIRALNRFSGQGASLFTPHCSGTLSADGENGLLCVSFSTEDPLCMRGTATLCVTAVAERFEPVSAPEEGLLLTIPAAAPEAEALRTLAAGDMLTLETDCAEGWEAVTSAVGILYPLLEEGIIPDGLEKTAAPRSAVGVKADGTLILYTADGRQSGYSTGLGLPAVAERLSELGCVFAGALDGGGSTQLSALLPGEEKLTTVNRPSDGSPRKVANYILIGTTKKPTGKAERLALYPLSIHTVPGAAIPLTVLASDRLGYAAKVTGKLKYQVSEGLGKVVDGVFYPAGNGSGTITVSCSGLQSASVPIRVVSSPETLELYGEKYGKNTKSLTLEPGQAVDLTVHAMDHHVLLTGDDQCYTWTLDAAAGTVDETGHLIPAEASGSGVLTAALGDRKVEIPITIWSGIPFSDVKRSDDIFEAVRYVYERGIFRGTGASEFRPETVMSRAMLVTMLWRLKGEPQAAVPAAFTDVVQGSWYADAVAWAAETGLVTGYDALHFGPEDDLTREQILTLLYRWAEEPAAEAETELPPELSEVHSYARPAMRWALETGILADEPETYPAPLEAMVRGEAAQVLMRWMEYSEAQEAAAEE